MNTVKLIHQPTYEYYKHIHKHYVKTCKHNVQTAFKRARIDFQTKHTEGEKLLKEMYDLFSNGMGISWSDVQFKIYNTFIDAILPHIYGTHMWPQVQDKVLLERKLNALQQWLLVSMGRRNGKTTVCSACCAVAFLKLRKIIIAVFSVAKFQSSMFQEKVIEQIEQAFDIGTHVKRSDYKEVRRNYKELWFQLKDGSINKFRSLPGSVSVSFNYLPPKPCYFYIVQLTVV